jgi:hypothetical protein
MILKNLPTHHEKIMIAEEIQDEFEILNTDIEDLIYKPTLVKKIL